MMNRSHTFSILILFYLLTEFDTVDFPLLIETQSGLGVMNATSLLFSSTLMITPQSAVLVSPQVSDLRSGVCMVKKRVLNFLFIILIFVALESQPSGLLQVLQSYWVRALLMYK